MDDVSRCTKENGKRIDRWRRHIVTTHRVVSPSILLVLAESRCLSFFVPLLSRRLPSPSGTNVLGYGPRFSRRASYKWPLHAGLKYIYIYVCVRRDALAGGTRTRLGRELEAGARSRHGGARLEAGLVDVVDGGARASGLGFMRPSYFASCEPVIPGRAPIYGPAVSRLRH